MPDKKPKRDLELVKLEIEGYYSVVKPGQVWKHIATDANYVVKDIFMDKFSQEIHISYFPEDGPYVPIGQPIARFLDGRTARVK